MIESKGVVIHSSGNIIGNHSFRYIMGDETTLHEAIINLERRVITLERIIEALHAPRNQPDPDCAVDPTGEWY